ncbi:MAG: TolC family protein [Oscillibacter sp.]|nr:TolC family protein [Oscillibacter sp.]
MKRRLTALLVMLALMASVCGVSALAEEPPKAGETGEAPQVSGESAGAEDAGETENQEDSENPENPEDPENPEEPEPPALAGPDLEESVAIEPDAVGQVSFANMERRMRENNLQILTLEQSVRTLEEIDYEDLYEDLRLQLNQIAKAQWQLVLGSGALKSMEEETGQNLGYSDYEYHSAYDQLDKAYDAVRDTFESIKDGDMQRDNADVIRQLNHLQDQMVVAGEALYVAVAAMETQEAGLARQLEALDRTVTEMELRYTLGQISAMQLSEVRAGRTSLESGLATLRMNIRNYKVQLEMMIGAEQTGEIRLGEVPEVTDAQLEAMELETDLAAAREKSYELYDAGKILEDARDDYKDAGSSYAYDEERYEFRSAKYTWQAAQYTYNNTVQNYELKFRTLYAQVKDYRQIWEAAKVSLACEQESYAAAELKYQQGTISQNALLTAADDLRAQENTVRSAAGDLFSAYNSYCWAVQHGILN